MNHQQQVCQELDRLGLKYQLYEHPAVFTAEDAAAHVNSIAGMDCKNLFLRNKKGDRHFLVVVPYNKKVDIQAISKQFELGHLSFGSPERLLKYLGLTPGSVSPFGIINDPEGLVQIFIDEDLLREEMVKFHPNINTFTLAMSLADFQKFLDNQSATLVKFIKIPELV